jgi:hypothetical protein
MNFLTDVVHAEIIDRHLNENGIGFQYREIDYNRVEYNITGEDELLFTLVFGNQIKFLDMVVNELVDDLLRNAI